MRKHACMEHACTHARTHTRTYGAHAHAREHANVHVNAHAPTNVYAHAEAFHAQVTLDNRTSRVLRHIDGAQACMHGAAVCSEGISYPRLPRRTFNTHSTPHSTPIQHLIQHLIQHQENTVFLTFFILNKRIFFSLDCEKCENTVFSWC